MAEAAGNDSTRSDGSGASSGSASGAAGQDRFQIDPDNPLPHLSTPSADAYEARDASNPARKLFALVCAHGLPVRTDVLAALQGERIPGLLPLVDWVRVDWPPLNRVCVAVIYEQPLGGRVKDEIPESIRPAGRVDLLKRVLKSAVAAFGEMYELEVTHRAIRPENIFFLDEGKETIVLGDCVTAPGGIDQPIAYETIEYGMTMPAGRGDASNAEDIYALGAVLAEMLLRVRDQPTPSEQEILQMKLEQGSFTTLVGDPERCPLGLRDAILGMLHDDTRDRWTAQEFANWSEGRKSASAGQRVRRRAEAKLRLGGHDYSNARAFAYAMGRHVTEAADLLRRGEVDGWLLRGLKSPEMAVDLKDLMSAARVTAELSYESDEYLVSRASMVMDPLAPIRFKGFSFMLDAFGSALAFEMIHKGETHIPMEVLTHNLPRAWLMTRANRSQGWEQYFAHLRTLAQNKNHGYGIERCLYEANPGFPCQGPLIAREYVVRLDEMLPALDRAVKRADGPARPFDRHMAAFIAARIDERIDTHLQAAADPREEVSSLGILSVFAVLQWRLQTPPAYALAKALGDLVQPAIDSYHSRTIRKEITKEKAAIVRRGSLVELYDLIENAKRRKKDVDGFAAAQAAFAAAEEEIGELATDGPERARELQETGRQMASISSILLTLIVISILLIVEAF